MKELAIITDTVADLPKEYIKENNIYLVSLYVIVDNQYYKDGVDINTDDINKLNEENPEFTGRTSAPSPGDFEEVFKKIKEDGYKRAVYISINPKLSGTMASASIADTGGLDVEIINSGSISILQGFLVMHAVNLLNDGYKADEIIDKIKKNVGNQRLFAWLNTLRNLKASGRLGRASKKITSLLNLKPIIAVDGSGNIDLVKIKTTREKSYDKIEKEIRKDLENCDNFYLSYHYGGDEGYIREIRERLIDLENRAKKTIIGQLGSVVATQVGPKTYSVGYIKLED